MAPEIRPLPKYHDPVTSLSITGSSSTIVRSPTLDSPTTGGSSRTGDSPRTVDGPQMADRPRTVGSVMIESDIDVPSVPEFSCFPWCPQEVS